MKQIELTNNLTALIDEQDFPIISRYNWRPKFMRKWYAATDINGRTVQMHRLILGLLHGEKVFVDHADGNGLNNCRSNLRLCDNQLNQFNRSKNSIRKYSESYKGVYWRPKKQKWVSSIRLNGTYIYIGIFRTPEEAALAYNVKAKECFGEFAKLNEVET